MAGTQAPSQLRTDSGPSWSAVIIARDEELTIGKCIESVLQALAQELSEVIVVDSGSTDRTAEIARRYPVRLVPLPADLPRCPAAARHAGFELARGGFVLFIDGDCELDADWLEPAKAALARDPRLAGIAGSAEGVILGADGRSPETMDQYPWAEYETPEFLSGSALYRREALARAGGFDPAMRGAEEIELGARLRRSGYELRRLRQRMTRHFPKARRETVAEIARRVRRGYPIGSGQLARRAISWNLPIAKPLAPISRHLMFFALLVAGIAAAVASERIGTTTPLKAWAAITGLAFAAFAVRARSLRKPAYYFLEWTLTAPMVVYGLLLRPIDPSRADSVGIDEEAAPAAGHRPPRVPATPPVASGGAR